MERQKIILRINDSMYKTLKKKAKEDKLSRNKVVINACEAFLKYYYGKEEGR